MRHPVAALLIRTAEKNDMIPFSKTKLSNGLRVILAPQKGSLAATVLVLVEAGSEYETKDKNGISHFLEHMCFKGTKNRPRPLLISQELDALGAEYNAFTSTQYTGYWAKARADKLSSILDIVSDLYLNPLFDEEEFKKEKGVIIEEINMYEDTPRRKVMDVFSQVMYGDQPAGWRISGTKESVKGLTIHDIIDYRKSRYTAPSTVVVVAGDFPSARVLKDIEKTFGSLTRAKNAPKPKTTFSQSRPAAALFGKESDQAHIVVGVRAFDLFDKRRFALEVLADALGGGMSSRLFERVRTQLGAAYYVRSGADLSLDHGSLDVAAGVDVARADVVLKAILEEMERFTAEDMGAAELRRVKDHIIGTTILSLEGTDEIASFYGGQEILTKKPKTIEAFINGIEKVSARAVRSVACDIIHNKGLNLAVLGPYKDPSKFEKILHFGK